VETRIRNFSIRVSHFESVRSLGDYAVCVALSAEAVRGLVSDQSNNAFPQSPHRFHGKCSILGFDHNAVLDTLLPSVLKLSVGWVATKLPALFRSIHCLQCSRQSGYSTAHKSSHQSSPWCWEHDFTLAFTHTTCQRQLVQSLPPASASTSYILNSKYPFNFLSAVASLNPHFHHHSHSTHSQLAIRYSSGPKREPNFRGAFFLRSLATRTRLQHSRTIPSLQVPWPLLLTLAGYHNHAFRTLKSSLRSPYITAALAVLPFGLPIIASKENPSSAPTCPTSLLVWRHHRHPRRPSFFLCSRFESKLAQAFPPLILLHALSPCTS
jgi:hypothetical protein